MVRAVTTRGLTYPKLRGRSRVTLDDGLPRDTVAVVACSECGVRSDLLGDPRCTHVAPLMQSLSPAAQAFRRRAA